MKKEDRYKARGKCIEIFTISINCENGKGGIVVIVVKKAEHFGIL
jgi:hypothetical protein